MPEATPGQSPEVPVAPAVAPAQTPEEIQALVNEAFTARLPGFQAAYEKQLAGLRTELAEARSDPDRSSADNSSRLEAELLAARQETEALRVARQYPAVFPVYEAILAAKGPVEQLEVLQGFVQGAPAAPAPPQAQPPAAPVAPAAAPIVPPPVEPNRPAQDPVTVPATPAGAMTKDLADRIIDGVGSVWPKF